MSLDIDALINAVDKNNNEEGSVVICKNQTCSEKLKSFDQVKKFLENNI